MRWGVGRRLRIGVAGLAFAASIGAAGFEAWWTPPTPRPSSAASTHELALRETDLRIAEVQRLMDELRAAMVLKFNSPADAGPRPPRDVGRPVVPACAAATCPDLGRIHGRPFTTLSIRELDTRLSGASGEITTLIERLERQRRAAADD